MDKKKFDVVVLGGGPGGYPAAIRAARNGKSVAIIEAKELGGTCLNRGCIPSKTLIANAEVLSAVKGSSEFGIDVKNVTFDYGKMEARKTKIVDKLRKGLEGLIVANKITVIRGFGRFESPNEIKVTGQDNTIVEGSKIIIATGSEPRNMSAFPFDYKRIHDSTSMLNLKTLPKSLIIIGGGIIGSEFASLHNALGVDVTILELLPRIIPMEAKEVSDTLKNLFLKRGIKIETEVMVQGIEQTEGGIQVKVAGGRTFEGEIALVSVGRKLNTSGIGLEKAGVLVEDNGMIKVNNKMETNVDGIYAIGDITTKWLLAHVATHQGVVAADNACGETAYMHYNAVPSVIYTHPEAATVGLSMEDALKKGYKAKIGAFPFQALGKSQAAAHTEGMAQIVIDEKTGQILGAQVVGYEASTLIAEMAVAITNELTVESISETMHAHPTISEAWLEAAFMAEGMPLHLPPKMK